ncbi:two-component system, NarL family, sensor histidine kinase DesK [Actinacidiphila rubida]|uniref:Two-component system, NarL family, sensor histidine kinase DesK n=1 Tax=Actinacidiphila rubida TaxID=310780 RepID=A0A1H8HB84_9ACTN|nr:sensor histidine kinase [Actinacidiphila rubida]SEN53350.1 two-component system, NarL family, sensor histidine kinase DesK [Actinacidiphila rubida]
MTSTLPGGEPLGEPPREPLRDPLPDPDQGPGSTSSSDAEPQGWAQGRRRTLLAAGMLAYPCVTAANLGQYASGGRALAGYLIVAAFCCCYALAAVSAALRSWGRLYVLLGVMTALFAAELPFARAYAFFLCAVVVSFVAVFLRQYAVPVTAAGALAALAVPVAVRPWHSGPGWFEAVALVFTAATVHAFAGIAATNRALVEARAEVARLASEAERNRIARDLHDLLGHSLTVITVKSALARRLAEAGSPRVLAEVTEVEQLTRQALADVRAAVTGYREVSLAGELARGREMLRAAGIVADLPTAVDVVAAEHRELFGWVVREGLTNVVRHSRATRCTVRLAAGLVEIRDDGAGRPAAPGVPHQPENAMPVGQLTPADADGPADAEAHAHADGPADADAVTFETAGPVAGPRPPAEGNGLTGLRERVAAAGGRVDAGPLVPRGWRLRVTFGGEKVGRTPS